MAAAVELSIDLVASTARFKGGMDQAKDMLKNFADHAKAKNKEGEESFAKLREGIEKVNEKLKKAGELIIGVFLFEKGKEAVKTLYETMERTAGSVDKIGKAAARLGVGVEQLSALKFAAEQSGIGFDTLTNLLAKGERQIAQFVTSGDGKAKKALQEIGVSLQDSSGHIRNMVELLPDLARGIGEVQDNAQRLNLAEQLFGRGNGEVFVQLIREMGDEFGELAEKEGLAKRLGVVFTPEQYKTAKLYKEAVEQVATAWFGLKVRVLEKLGPLITEWHEKLAKFIAVVPALFGNLVNNVRAFMGGTAGKDIEQAFGSLFVNLELLESSAIKHLFELALALVGDGVRLLIPGLVPVFDAIGVGIFSAFTSMVVSVNRKIYGFLHSISPGGTLGGPLDAFAEVFKISADLAEIGRTMPIQAGIENISESIKSLSDSVFNGDSISSPVLADGLADIHARLRAIGGDADVILGLSEALAKAGVAAEEFGKKAGAGGGAAGANKNWLDFKTGFADGFEELRIHSEDFKGFGKAIAGEFGELSDGIAHSLTQTLLHAQNFWQGFKTTFANVGEMVIETALKFVALRAVVAGVAGVGNLFAGSSAVGQSANLGDAYGSPSIGTYAATGNAFSNGSIVPFARGGIVTRPTLFPMANGSGLMGEAGPEAVMPLTRINGQLGVRAAGGGGDVTVQVIDQRSGGAKPTVTQGTGPDGRKLIQVLIRDEVNRVINSGEADRSMSSSFGLSRTGTRR